jgi:hypothetical protein
MALSCFLVNAWPLSFLQVPVRSVMVRIGLPSVPCHTWTTPPCTVGVLGGGGGCLGAIGHDSMALQG